jgi:hypothetical protein
MFIACNTSAEEGSPQFASIELTPQIAAELLKYRSAVEQARKISDGFYCVEFFESRVLWGDTDLNIGDEWVQVPSGNAVYGGDEYPICAETLKAPSLAFCGPQHRSIQTGILRPRNSPGRILRRLPPGTPRSRLSSKRSNPTACRLGPITHH